jgi:rRNA processing protein Gar1
VVHDASRGRSIGNLLSVTPSGEWTVRSGGREFATEGTEVVDRTGRWRGRVVRVFGPVERPYLAVRPRRTPGPAEGLSLIGAELVRA